MLTIACGCPDWPVDTLLFSAFLLDPALKVFTQSGFRGFKVNIFR